VAEASGFYHIGWAHGEVTVRAVGGMIAPAHFDLGDGHSISPLHVAPWAGAPDQDLSPLLAGLRGEWPCLPFGPARVPDKLPPAWSARQPDDLWDHGYCANHVWKRVDSGVDSASSALALAIDLPAADAVARLERTIRPDPDSPAIEVELVIHPRRDAVIPFALHPTFVVPVAGVELVGGSYSAVHTYPIPAEPGVSRLMPNRSAASLKELPLASGRTLDATRLPLAFKTEELLQLADCKPPFVLRYPAQQAEVLLDWDSAQLPDALLWISNGGRAHAPWCGTHYALGIEPNNSCFDLSRVAIASAEHPLAKRSGLRLKAGVPMHITYRLSARRFAVS
jgi:hypothetical protein